LPPGTGYLNKASTILPSGTITIPGTWILPNNTKLVGVEPSTTASIASGTVILAKSSFTPMIQFGDSPCPSSICNGISVEGVILDGNGFAIDGIHNTNGQDLSYVDHVAIYNLFGTGLMVDSGAAHSGPYTNITFDTGTASSTAPTACAQIEGVTTGTHGIHGMTCISNSTTVSGTTAVFLDATGNTIEDVRIVGFETGILVGSKAQAKSNVLRNIIGDTNGSSSVPVYVVQISTTKPVTDLALMAISNTVKSPTDVFTILDNLTGTKIQATSTSTSVGLYVLGEGTTSNGTTIIGYSRFTTATAVASTSTNQVATWVAGANAPSGSCSVSGSLFSVTGSGGHLYLCEGNPPSWVSVK
jgi:hypothetical protein